MQGNGVGRFLVFFYFADVEESGVDLGSRRAKGDLYFSELYSPWQRGSNENGNGMVRRFFAQGTDFSNISATEIRKIAYLLKNRSRKILDSATRWEIYSGRAQLPSSVAL